MSYLGKTYYQAQAEESKRESQRGIYEIRRRQRDLRFAYAAKALEIGKSLWDTYSSNRELIEFAESRGLKATTSKFTNTFGTPEFQNEAGDTVTRSMVLAAQAIQDYENTKSMLDIISSQGVE